MYALHNLCKHEGFTKVISLMTFIDVKNIISQSAHSTCVLCSSLYTNKVADYAFVPLETISRPL